MRVHPLPRAWSEISEKGWLAEQNLQQPMSMAEDDNETHIISHLMREFWYVWYLLILRFSHGAMSEVYALFLYKFKGSCVSQRWSIASRHQHSKWCRLWWDLFKARSINHDKFIFTWIFLPDGRYCIRYTFCTIYIYIYIMALQDPNSPSISRAA